MAEKYLTLAELSAKLGGRSRSASGSRLATWRSPTRPTSRWSRSRCPACSERSSSPVPFVPTDLLHEVKTGTLRGHIAHIGIDCDGCYRDCSLPVGIMRDGDFVARKNVQAYRPLVSWPRCPLEWDVVRPLGLEHLPLSEHLRHADPVRLHAGGAMLWREWRRVETLREPLREAYLATHSDG